MASILEDKSEPGVVILSLNRPEKRNALSVAMMDELKLAVNAIEKDSSQRVIILKGEGNVFCAGLDLAEAKNMELAERSAHAVASMLGAFHGSPLMTIAAVQGAAMAGGLGLACACDVVIAEEYCLFGFPETKRGLVPAQVAALLAGQIGSRNLKELLLLGNEISPERALEIGMINRVVKKGSLMDTAKAVAREFLLGAPGALSKTKELLEKLSPSPFLRSIDLALEVHHEARVSEEAKEGIEAFFEKRAPKWVL